MEQKPKGTRDILPNVVTKWHFMEDTARKLAKQYNIDEIRTPTFENETLYNRSVGESSDIVTKEMYTFKDKADRKLALRPEGTAGVVRAFLENGLFNNAQPTKLFYIANNFRYENTQAGRFREFSQFGVEYFGSAEPSVDAEQIVLASKYLTLLGINDVELQINNIGCPQCRAEFNKALKEFAHAHKQDLCKDCNNRMDTNPLRMLDCKNEKCQAVFKDAPKLEQFLCDECKQHFDAVLGLLDARKIKYTLNTNLVRGLDYYTKTVFEFVAMIDNKPLTVCGGGRYDGLVAEIGGNQVPACGFACGLDRLVCLIDDKMIGKKDLVYIANTPDVDISQVLAVAEILRSADICVETNLANRSFKAQMKYADKIGANKVVILGQKEIDTGEFVVKNLRLGSECSMSANNLIKYLKLDSEEIKKITKTYRD